MGKHIGMLEAFQEPTKSVVVKNKPEEEKKAEEKPKVVVKPEEKKAGAFVPLKRGGAQSPAKGI